MHCQIAQCFMFIMIHVLEKLFDSFISPIILYCSELWAVDLPLKDSDPYEYLHLKIKEILGVHYKSTNVACRAELSPQ